MLQAAVNEAKSQDGHAKGPQSSLPERERYPLSVETPSHPSLTGNGNSIPPSAAVWNRSAAGSLQRLYGNQAVLQMRNGSGGATAPLTPLRPSQNGILQRKCACGGAAGVSGKCEECSQKMGFGLQTKLTIGEPGDAYEQEADRVADQLMAAPAHPATSGAPPRIQRYSAQPAGQTNPAPASVDQALASPGKPLEPALRQGMEQRFGHDFSRVRVHSGEAAERSAREVDAHAYTVGHNMVFGAGQFEPGTHEGQRLLAHELTHVVQQSGMNKRRVSNTDKNPGFSHTSSISRVGIAIQRDTTKSTVKPFTKERKAGSFHWIGKIYGTASAALRSTPQKDPKKPHAGTIADLDVGTIVEVFEQKGGWLHVTTSVGGKEVEGYVSHELVLFLTSGVGPEPAEVPEPAKAPPQVAVGPPKAAWVALDLGVYAYLVGRDGMTLNDVAAYMTGHPNLPDLLAKVNGLPRTQRLQEGYPVVVPIEYIDDRRQAWTDMPSHIRESIADTREAQANRKAWERFAVPKSGHPLGPGAVGLIPITAAMMETAGIPQAAAAVLQGLKQVGKLIKGLILAPYYAAKSIIAFVEGLIDGVRGNVGADDLEKIIHKKPGKLDLVLFVPAYSAGVVKGIIDEGQKMLEGFKDIISDPLAFLKSLAELIIANLSGEGEEIFHALGQATGKQFAAYIKGLTGESLAGFAYGVGKIAGFVVAQIILALLGAKVGEFVLEVLGKLGKSEKFAAFVEKFLRKRPETPRVPKQTVEKGAAGGAKAAPTGTRRMGGETAGGVVREYPGGAKLRRGAGGRLRFCYNPCIDAENLKLPEDVIAQAIGNYIAEPAELAAMLEFVEARGELATVQELFRDLAEGGDSAVRASHFLREVTPLHGHQFNLNELFEQYKTGVPVPSPLTFDVEMKLRSLEQKMEVELGKAVEGKPFKPPKREVLDEVEGLVEKEAREILGRNPTPNELNNYRNEMGYSERISNLQEGKSSLQGIEEVGGGAEHTRARPSTKGKHEEGRRQKLERERRAKERLLRRR